MPVTILPLDLPATDETFNEQGYLTANPDVAAAVRAGRLKSGRQHFDLHGKHEQRKIRRAAAVDALRAAKLARLLPLLRLDMPHERRGDKLDFLSKALRAETRISPTENVSANGYDGNIGGLIRDLGEGLLLDCGAGKRSDYYSNVVNYEIVDYDTTDLLGVGEALPFVDNAFDGVISVAVLEHVCDPFRCAAELVRVLKPGGKMICCVPFLQPYHGYPHHYYNMTGQGLRALFEDRLVIDDHRVIESVLPVFTLNWIVTSWAAGLPPAARESFLNMPVREPLKPPQELSQRDWSQALPVEKNFELASATVLFAHKK